ncbi:MAG: hypothetical protein AAFX10_00325 [Pseudomonadota bacterium]
MILRISRLFAVCIALFAWSQALAQSEPERITIPLTRPGEPVTLDVSILSARIEVIGEDRDDAEFEVSVADGKRQIITPSGPKPLTTGGYSFEVEESDNQISVDTDWRSNRVVFVARIPADADLELSTVNDGEIIVRNVRGRLQLENANGPITATGITGSVIAESINEDIDVAFQGIAADEVVSLNSINGNLTVALPANAGAELHIDTARGEIRSDFEVDVRPSKPIIERNDNQRGVEVRIESVIIADVNGGGPVVRLKSLNGNITIANAGTAR